MRVVQGKEPPHFLAIFGGNFTVFSGGVSGAFDDVKRNVEVGSTYLLQIHGRWVVRPADQLYYCSVRNRIAARMKSKCTMHRLYLLQD